MKSLNRGLRVVNAGANYLLAAVQSLLCPPVVSASVISASVVSTVATVTVVISTAVIGASRVIASEPGTQDHQPTPLEQFTRLSGSDNTQPPTTIYGYELEYRLKPEEDRQYRLLFTRMATKGLAFDLKIQPYTRITRDMEIHRDCFFPASLSALSKSFPKLQQQNYLASDPVDFVSLRVLTPANQPVISHMNQLNGKRIALWGGLDPEIYLKDLDVHVENTPNETVRLRMLHRDRVDAMLGFVPDVALAAESLNLPLPHYDPSLAVFDHEGASIICHRNHRNQALLYDFNRHLADMRDSGELRSILGPHAILRLTDQRSPGKSAQRNN